MEVLCSSFSPLSPQDLNSKFLDNFTLADTVIEAVVGDSTVVTQLIARDASGGLRIR